MFLPEEWLLKVAVKRGVYGCVKGTLTVLTYAKSQVIMKQLGIHVNPAEFQAGAPPFVLGWIEIFHDYLRLKFPGCRWL